MSNATEDSLESLGQSPDIESHSPKYQPVEPVTYYRARCTSCGTYAEYSEFGAFSDPGTAIEAARDECAWFERNRCEPAPTPDNPWRVICHPVELFCRDCRRCEVCGTESAYVIDEGEPHMVCAAHEDHNFETAR